MLLLGIDTGTSAIKVSIVDAASQRLVASAQYPETETGILSVQPGWAEQHPDTWWQHIQQAIAKCHASGVYDPLDIAAIGIAYQMHGLVLVDQQQQVLRPAIIWCDSRAVDIGDKAFHCIGEERCLRQLLNSPGNFTASKLAWVKANEPAIYEKIHRVLLPGDFVAMRLTGDTTTSVSALSEGVFWDFHNNQLSEDVLRYFGFPRSIFPNIQPVFSPHGYLLASVASSLGLKAGIPVGYKAGDQPNNALALNVLQPGEVATTAGTSGVIYGVTDTLGYDTASRINGFAHVNHLLPGTDGTAQTRIGVLLCINGTGIFNRWIRQLAGAQLSYAALNAAAAAIPAGAEGLRALPFGNGAERMLSNRLLGAQLQNIDLNIHGTGHLVRAVQEGIAFAFRYGLDIMRENGINPSVARAGRSNLFLSDVFTQSFVNTNQVAVEFFEGDGSYGAALGAGIGAGIYDSPAAAAGNRQRTGIVEPDTRQAAHYEGLYQEWKALLEEQLNRQQH
ncbi:MAG: FGGY family carbohydrate kinase [Candidatus Pseudobacter hemicellulosilyticus]|uniref:FGGY family carbohydrate kinase n=1 Tax=Candidatus Pseudobacter hemicellulosilyticus TaxID=3121375 RepID=A0AAJ6BI76_9BACT|nr:MAG: FGGY family carbohydrate kinase [Pseudobacter sp.]